MNERNREIDSIFGPRTWDDVRMSVMRTTARRWPGMSREDVEDAVGDAMLDLVDYWVSRGSSVTDDYERNFAYAVTRGNWKARASMVRALGATTSQVPLFQLDDESADQSDFIGELAQEPFGDWRSNDASAPKKFQTPSAEDVLLAHLEHNDVVEAVAGLAESEFDRWFADFWSGDTLVDVAERRGESPDAVRMRQVRGLDRLTRNAA